MKQPPTIITVTGTKGKTTVVSVIAEAMRTLGRNTLHVTTNGHYMNGVQLSTLADSKRIWGLKTPSLIPGRYLTELTHAYHGTDGDDVAVLEATFSNARTGLGYRQHDVGIFLNIFHDHIDPNGSVRNQQELAAAKSFVFSKVKEDGAVVFNADDEHVCSVLSRVPSDTVRLIPCGLTFEHFDLEHHLRAGGEAVTVREGNLVLLRQQESLHVLSVAAVAWTYGGQFKPSLWNLMHSFGGLYAGLRDQVPVSELAVALSQTTMNESDGRLVVLQAPGGVTVIADYAHEPESLAALAALGREFITNGGALLGVVRLSHERPDEVLREGGKQFAHLFDRLIIYDKIDGYWRRAEPSTITRYPQIEGRTSQVVYEAAAQHNPHVERIVREDHAIAKMADMARPGDVVVVIVNDDARRSIEHIKTAFNI